MPFKFERLRIPDVILIKPEVFGDERGFFLETYLSKDFGEAGIKEIFIFDCQSKSKHGVLRGLHFQKGLYAQAKIVKCIKGEIYDVAVDLRKNSPTLGKYAGTTLSEHNKYSMYIPRGFAHGFVVMSEEAGVFYKIDNIYSPENEWGLIWNDQDVSIPWPINKPVVSMKDKKWPNLKELIKSDMLF